MKNIFLLTGIVLSVVILFLACSEERDHASPFDPEYWNSEKTPSNIQIKGLNLTSAEISWTDNSIEDMFIIERKLNSSPTWNRIGEVQGDEKTGVIKHYFDNSLEIEKTYSYRVYAFFNEISSKVVQSEDFQSVLFAPSNFSISDQTDSSIKLSWVDNSTDEAGFIIDRKAGVLGTWVEGYSLLNPNTTTWTNTGLSIGTTYYYKIRAYYSSTVYSSYTNEVFTEIVPIGFISVPIGSFSMGSNTGDSDETVHTVNITRSYYLGKYEVTQKEWVDVMGSNPASGAGVGDNYPIYRIRWYSTLVYCNRKSIAESLAPCYTINNSTNPDLWGGLPLSMDDTWDAVICDFNAKGYRLPTEAEWEYAARYNDSRTYPWGNTSPTNTLCNYGSVSTAVVTSYPSGCSLLGLLNMAGNVWEWVWDWYGPYSSTLQTNPNPTGATSGTTRVLRGGSWYVTSSFLRSSNRYYYSPDNAYSDVGFRIARTK